MACDGSFATPEEFSDQWYFSFDDDEVQELEPLLRSSAGRIHAALAATGQCDCGFAGWATEYLKELNMTAAVVTFNISGVRLSNDQRLLFSEYLTEQLALIRTGEIELCGGETGKQHPAFGVAEIGITDRNIARIVANRVDREG